MWSSGLPSHFGNHVLWAGQEEGKKGEKATGGEKIAEFRYEAAQQSQRDGTGKDRPPAPTGHLIQQRDEKPIKENGL